MKAPPTRPVRKLPIAVFVEQHRDLVAVIPLHSALTSVNGHQDQDLPSDGHEVAAMAITEGDRIRWSSRREIYSDRRFGAADCLA
jgi:hypothetical protein